MDAIVPAESVQHCLHYLDEIMRMTHAYGMAPNNKAVATRLSGVAMLLAGELERNIMSMFRVDVKNVGVEDEPAPQQQQQQHAPGVEPASRPKKAHVEFEVNETDIMDFMDATEPKEESQSESGDESETEHEQPLEKKQVVQTTDVRTIMLANEENYARIEAEMERRRKMQEFPDKLVEDLKSQIALDIEAGIAAGLTPLEAEIEANKKAREAQRSRTLEQFPVPAHYVKALATVQNMNQEPSDAEIEASIARTNSEGVFGGPKITEDCD